MIYPSEFPTYNENIQEELVYKFLSCLSKEYDIFHSRKFIGKQPKEKKEYEADFIICIPNKAIICLEVKGGLIKYDGIANAWTQNSNKLDPPDKQASSIAHSLVDRYKRFLSDVPITWVVCFPDCEVPDNAPLPTSLSYSRIIDQNGLLHLEFALKDIFKSLYDEYPSKNGCRDWQYNEFKVDLLRGIGFVKVLGTRVKHDEERFIQLEEEQIEIFNSVIENNRIIVTGPAGTSIRFKNPLIFQGVLFFKFVWGTLLKVQAIKVS